MPTHHTLQKLVYEYLTYDSIVLCEQIKTISKRRLSHRIGVVSQEDMKTIGEKLCVSIAL